MKYDIVLSGVGGQGVVSLASIIASGAQKEGLYVKQSEVHGMAQRGGAVVSNVRISDKFIESDMIPSGSASMILSMEPLESLRYLGFLSKDGLLISSTDPVNNISNYPEINSLLDKLRCFSGATLVNSKKLAANTGNSRAANFVMLGAASNHLPIKNKVFKDYLVSMFEKKGQKVVESNLNAFESGKTVTNFLTNRLNAPESEVMRCYHSNNQETGAVELDNGSISVIPHEKHNKNAIQPTGINYIW